MRHETCAPHRKPFSGNLKRPAMPRRPRFARRDTLLVRKRFGASVRSFAWRRLRAATHGIGCKREHSLPSRGPVMTCSKCSQRAQRQLGAGGASRPRLGVPRKSPSERRDRTTNWLSEPRRRRAAFGRRRQMPQLQPREPPNARRQRRRRPPALMRRRKNLTGQPVSTDPAEKGLSLSCGFAASGYGVSELSR